MTPSVEMKACDDESGAIFISPMWKFSMYETLRLPYGEPPLSSSSTLYLSDSVAASGQPAVPPPTMM